MRPSWLTKPSSKETSEEQELRAQRDTLHARTVTHLKAAAL